MRILYITFENPAVETILNGMKDEELQGLPALYFPFKKLAERGHTIDMLLITGRDHKVVSSRLFSKNNLILLKITHSGIRSKFEMVTRLAGMTRRLIKERRYDFVYGMGEGTYPGIAAAYKMGIPAALRQFGVQEMVHDLENVSGRAARHLKALKKYPFITLSIHGKMTFLLTTNDGSRADQLYELMGVRHRHYSFYFWRSGIYIPDSQPVSASSEEERYPETYSTMHISHIGRITAIKRQDRSVRILAELHRKGYKLHLHFIGNRADDQMLEMVMSLAREYGLEDYVHAEGSRSQKDCRKYGRNSLATLMVAELNCGNAFYEVMSEGCVVLTNNNHSVDEYIEDGVNCLVYEEDNYIQAAEKIIALLKNPELSKDIRRNAYLTAKNKFLSLDERFDLEVHLIEDTAAGKHDLSHYPEVL